MIQQEMTYRVLYADTDAMGVMYYGNYMRIYEAARGDFMRKIDLPLSLLFEHKIVCPVVKVNIDYIKFVKYDDEIIIRTKIETTPKGRMVFIQEIFDTSYNLMNTAEIHVVFVNVETTRPVRCPDFLIEKLKTM